MKRYTKIAEHINELNLNTEGLTQLTVSGKKICIANFQNKLYACAAKCPHASVPLETGYIDAKGNIVCAAHRYKFNLESGANVSGEGYWLCTYTIECTSDGSIYIDLEKNK